MVKFSDCVADDEENVKVNKCDNLSEAQKYEILITSLFGVNFYILVNEKYSHCFGILSVSVLHVIFFD